MTDREERIKKAAERFATAVVWEIYGPPMIVCGILAAGFLLLAILSSFGLL